MQELSRLCRFAHNTKNKWGSKWSYSHNAIPKKPRQDTNYCIRAWEAWRGNRNLQPQCLKSLQYSLSLSLAIKVCAGSVKTKLGRIPAEHLHQIVSRYVRVNLKPQIDFFLYTCKDAEFADLRSTLDAEMKRLQAKGFGIHSQTSGPIIMFGQLELAWLYLKHIPRTIARRIYSLGSLPSGWDCWGSS